MHQKIEYKKDNIMTYLKKNRKVVIFDKFSPT